MQDEKVKVISLDIENVKRVHAVQIVPTPTGLTIIGGRNKQGKSSCLDSICATLGGEKFNPSAPIKDGEKRGQVTVELSNGITAKRIYTPGGSRLEISGGGEKSGQALLNDFISVFALDLTRFLNASDKEKAKILLEIIGVDLQPYEEREKKLYAERENVGRLEKKARGHAESLPFHEESGTDLVTTDSLMKELQAVVSHNAENRKIRQNLEDAKRKLESLREDGLKKQERVEQLREQLEAAETAAEAAVAEAEGFEAQVQAAQAKTEGLTDQDESQIKSKLDEIDSINIKIRENLERERAFADADGYRVEYNALTDQIEEVRRQRIALLDGAEMPLHGLTIEDGLLSYNGKPWDCMSHAEQLIASTAICQATNPKMGFVLVDKLEAMDLETLEEFRAFLESEGLQAITTRVSTGGECSLIIEDGEVSDVRETKKAEPTYKF